MTNLNNNRSNNNNNNSVGPALIINKVVNNLGLFTPTPSAAISADPRGLHGSLLITHTLIDLDKSLLLRPECEVESLSLLIEDNREATMAPVID